MYMPSLFREDLFDNFFDGNMRGLKGFHNRDKNIIELMKTDIKETDDSYEIMISLPGIKKENVKAEVNDGYLTITANTFSENENKDDKGHYIRKERYEGSVQRSFYIGEGIKQEDIKAKLDNGVLNLSVPKIKEQPKEEVKKYIDIL